MAAAIAVVLRAREVVLVKRRNPPDAGLWSYPGGKIETGETVLAAAVRELHEETGIFACPRQMLTPFDVFHRDIGGQLLGHFILLPVLCDWISGMPHASSDALDAAWFTIDSLEPRAAIMSRHVPGLARQALAMTSPEPSLPGR